MTNDKHIAQMCNTDLNKGFAMLVNAYQQKVYWHIRRLVVNHEDAEDLLQEVFVKSYRSWHSFRNDCNICTWLYKIATNECITFLNRKKMRIVTENDDVGNMNSLPAGSEYTGYAEKAAAALQQAVQKLPDMQRLVFNMRYYDDMSYDDIAQVTGSSTSAAKTNYHIAKNKVTEYVRQLF